MVTASVYKERIERLQELLSEREIDGVAIIDLENYFYFTGDTRKQPRLYVPKSGEPLLLVFRGEEEEARRESWIRDIRTYGSMHEMMTGVISWIQEHNIKTIGFDFEFALPAFLLERFKLANPTLKVVDAKDAFMELRMIKSREEVDLMKRAAEIAAEGMEVAKGALKEGAVEFEVAGEVEYAMRGRGAERFAFPTFINSGYRSHWLHGLATRKGIEKGDLVLVDVGPVYMGYCANMTRMFVVGDPNDDQRKLIDLYIKARQAAVDAARPGTMLTELDNVAQRVITQAGFGEYYVRGIAHGVGLSFEEKPFPTIFPEDNVVELKQNMTISIGHPILSLPSIGGARVEDGFLITREGARRLVEYPEELMVV
ncbi:MAG: M24 family metallopeptidase [Candidatus Bathyarchaeia archaeon]